MKYSIILLFSVVLLGCERESGCTEFGADNYNSEAVVDDGSCIAARDKFIGDFIATSNCFDNPYSTNVVEGDDDDELTISNLADTLVDISATIFLNEITISDQLVGLGVSVEGAGLIMGQDSISLSYRIIDTRTGVEQTTDCFELFIRE